MPKRDLAYMDGQREAIARAALAVMFDKGVYGTSLRDICEQAGISMGTFYVHFRTKEEAVVAAFALDNHERRIKPEPLPETRSEYLERLRQGFIDFSKDPVEIRRSRLSLQFVADMALESANPPGLSDIYEHHRIWTRRALEKLLAKGEIELPLGLDRSVDAIHHAALGANYMAMGNKDLDVAEVADGIVALLKLTLTHPPKPKG
ncbi:MAG: TetR/AcrR family transcriptional regulator [Caulobacteraceae bacterium]